MIQKKENGKIKYKRSPPKNAIYGEEIETKEENVKLK
jgi:hypothetical protein